jgi:hypothetical protein
MTSALPRSDFVRAPLLAAARPEGYKEWHHFVIHRPGWRLLVNFSIASLKLAGRAPRLVPRVIVIAHEERWVGAVERLTEAELDVSADLGSIAIGVNRMTVGTDGYHVTVDLPDRGIGGELHLTPTSRQFFTNNQPIGAGRVSWLFVPRLRADGWFRIDGREHRMDGDLAYHDHNWGRFRWGDDFGWTWGSVLPATPDDPWSFVFSRMTDRRGLRTVAQAFYVWHRDEPAAIFRDAAVRVRSSGMLGRPPDCTLPPPMRLVLGDEVANVPASVVITARRAGDALHAEFRPESYARIAQPSEVCLDRSVVLCETSGSVHVEGSVGGEAVDCHGPAVFELLHG